MYDIVSFGQAVLDVYLMSKKFRIVRDERFITGQAECFAFGTKVELDDILFEVGGGATNTAVTFSRLGLSATIVTKIGIDYAGEEIMKSMKEHGVSTSHVIVNADGRSGYDTIFLTSSGERTILVYRGISHTLSAKEIPWPKIHAKWFYVSSLAGNIFLLRSILRFAKKKKIKVALNPGALELRHGLSVLKPLIRDVDVLLLNRAEASKLLSIPFDRDRSIVRGLDKVCNGVAVITEGEKGSWVCDGKVLRRIHINPVKAVDTTGAGDAYGSGFVAGMIKRPGDFDYALRLASINSASVVQQIGAKHGLISRRLPHGKKWMRIRVEQIRAG